MFRLLCLVAAGSISACGAPEFVERGPQELILPQRAVRLERAEPSEIHGLRAPSITVTPPSSGLEAYRAATVVADENGGLGLRTLALTTNKGRVVLTYSPLGGQALPVTPGMKLKFRWYPEISAEAAARETSVEVGARRELFVSALQRLDQPELRIGGLRGWSLIVRDMRGALVAAVFSGVEVPFVRKTPRADTTAAGVRSGVSLRPLRDVVVYEQVRRVGSGCELVRTHHAVRATELRDPSGADMNRLGKRSGASFDALPGTWRFVTLQGLRYRLVVIDASSMGEARCADSGEAHFSVALLLDRRTRAR